MRSSQALRDLPPRVSRWQHNGIRTQLDCLSVWSSTMKFVALGEYLTTKSRFIRLASGTL
jgi:hypothetical protein